VIRFVNSALLNMLGCRSEQEMVGRPATDFLRPENQDAMLERNRAREQGQSAPTHYEFKALRKDGSTFDAEVSIGRLSYQGRVATQAIVRDITERKLVEQALEQRTHDLGERVKELDCLYGISKLADEPDISLEEIVQGTVDLIPASYQYPEVACARIVLEDQEFGTENFSETPWRQTADITVHGAVIGFVEVSYLEERPGSDEGPFLKEERRLINTVAGRMGRITGRKRSEEALQASEEQFRLVTDAVPVLISYVDSQQRYRFNNEAYEEWFGRTRAESYGEHVKDVLGDSAYEAIREHIESALSGKEVAFEDRVPYRDGGARHVSATYVPDITDEGEVRGFVALVRDITKRKQAEEALRESEERYRDVVEWSPFAMVVHSDEKMVFVNSAAVRLFGAAAPDHIVGKPIWDFVHPDDHKAVRKRMRGARPRRKKVDLVEEKLVRLDGQVVDVEMAAIPVTYQGKAARQVVLRDITERKQMEEALQDARDELESRVERRMQRGTVYGLTFREMTVLHLMADGRSDKEIGSVLGISILTAQKHVENIRAKMKASSRTKASVRAVREGLVK
jgi:PAS domain S-box-containing protein